METSMRFRLAAIAALAAAALISSCSSNNSSDSNSSTTSAHGGTIPLLRVGTTQPLTTLNPTRNFGAWVVDDLTLDTVMKLGPQAQVEPNLATSVSHPNPVTYVYHLRHGVKFWDGDPLTATDVVYSWNYVRGPGSQAAYNFPAVKSIVAASPYTVVVTLPAPDPAWQYTPGILFSGIFEAKFAEAHKSDFGKPGTLVMGSGPWKIDSLDPTTGAELSANPHWWGGKVPIRHISVKLFSTETSEALAFRAGEIDLDPTVSDPKTYAATSGAKLMSASSCNNGFLTMNTRMAPWSDVHFRRAVAYALNRTDIIAAAGGYATPLSTFISPAALTTVASSAQVSQLLSAVNLYPYSLAKAKQELAQSAYPHGASVTIQTWSGGDTGDVAQAEAAELGKIGITAHVKVVPLSVAQVDANGPADKRPSTAWEGGCTTPDVSGFDFYLGSGGLKAGQWNEAAWAPANVDHWLTQGTTTDNAATRFAAFSNVVKAMAADVPYVPLYLHDVTIALAKNFADPSFNYWTFFNDNYALGITPAS
jgi:peptide/nickel transport system substrate-binding protein